MSQNTIVKFRPFVCFKKNDAEHLKLTIHGQPIVLKIPPTENFDFQSLHRGVEEKNIDSDLLKTLVSSDVCEFFSEEISTPSGLSPAVLRFKAFFRNWDDIAAADKKLQSDEIQIINLGRQDIKFNILKEMSVRTKYITPSELPTSSSFAVVVAEGYHQKELLHLSQELFHRGINWLLIKADDKPQIGPFFNTNAKQGCYSCFYKRIQSKDRLNEEIEVSQPSERDSIFTLALDTLGLQILRYFLTSPARLERNIEIYDPLTMTSATRPFFVYPTCEICK